MSKTITPAQRLIVALDFPTVEQALDIVEKLRPLGLTFKIGMELYTTAALQGINIVAEIEKRGGKVFFDQKFNDIPNTVGGASAATAKNPGIEMFNFHGLGGLEQLVYAVAGVQKSKEKYLLTMPPKSLEVTALTSLDDKALKVLGFRSGREKLVWRLTYLGLLAGVDGYVCSANDIQAARYMIGQDKRLVVPGIRFSSDAVNDQKVVGSPYKAMADGADYIVVGRPITAATDPIAAAEKFILAIMTSVSDREVNGNRELKPAKKKAIDLWISRNKSFLNEYLHEIKTSKAYLEFIKS